VRSARLADIEILGGNIGDGLRRGRVRATERDCRELESYVEAIE
jgi:hypothetical protein